MNRTVTLTKDGEQIRVTPQQATVIYLPAGWGTVDGEAELAENEPPRSGAGSGIDAWRTYAASVGVSHDDDATRDDIITAVDALTNEKD